MKRLFNYNLNYENFINKISHNLIGWKIIPIRLLKNFLYFFLFPLFLILELISREVHSQIIIYANIGVILIMILVSMIILLRLKHKSNI